ncbi:MAG TPA: response regulator [Candidatus Limnocylindrales bacterium]|nr:response regulator [Candidatus Limnocylindrales bacterium]
MRSVLVVEDEPDLRQVLSELLREEGFAVTEAVDGVEALARCGEARVPELVVLDLMLPRLDGFEFIAAVRKRGLAMPIIAMSASSEHLRTAQGLGIVAALHKPFLLETLLAEVQRELGAGSADG